jgi:hypothetical protein
VDLRSIGRGSHGSNLCIQLMSEYSNTTANEKERDMKYRLLGKSGLRVSEASLGTMTFGDEWGMGITGG